MNSHPLLLLILAACGPIGGAVESGTACVDVPDDETECPEAADVDIGAAFVPLDCDGNEVRGVSGAGALQERPTGAPDTGDTAHVDLVCCYDAELLDPTPNQDCMVGRPLPKGAQAGLVARADWSGDRAGALGPASEPAGPGATDAARAWAAAGLGEHASIGAFLQLGLELLAHGAPADLVRDVLRAAGDELRHAERCFALAERGGEPVGPGALPLPTLRPTRPLAEIAVDAMQQGCVIETLGAIAARVAAAGAADPEVQATLAVLAADEERHAVLSWRVLSWAVGVGGPEVRQAVRAAFTAPIARLDVGPLALRAGMVAEPLAAAVADGVRSVIEPAGRKLLAG